MNDCDKIDEWTHQEGRHGINQSNSIGMHDYELSAKVKPMSDIRLHITNWTTTTE